ncbi:MAG: hypothetical protein IJK75_08345 [Bacteroidales bacterium]|nr:hypothetical protein [Bacteroidales bacterium]
MNNRFAIITILIASAAMLLSGCDQTQEQYGKKVQFSASTKGAPSTKTSYSGYFREKDNTPLYQRINWEAGDVIRIYSPKGEGNLWSPNMDLEATNVITGNPYLKLVFSDYTLNTISPDPEKPWQSTAKLYNNGDNGLTWTGNTATFYGAYPVNDADNDGMDEKLIPHALDYGSGGQTVQHLLMEINVPGAGENGQTGDSTLVSTMPLLAKAVVQNGNPVKLDFYPYFSAYEFNLKSKDQAMIINSLTVSAEEGYIWGRFFWDITSNTPFNYNSTPEHPLNEETSRTITVSREGGWAISPTQEANITIFGLPNDLGKITLTINFTTGGVTKNATLFLYDPANPTGDSYAVFSACKKTRIKGLQIGGVWKIFIAAVDVDEWQEVGTTTLII